MNGPSFVAALLLLGGAYVVLCVCVAKVLARRWQDEEDQWEKEEW